MNRGPRHPLLSALKYLYLLFIRAYTVVDPSKNFPPQNSCFIWMWIVLLPSKLLYIPSSFQLPPISRLRQPIEWQLDMVDLHLQWVFISFSHRKAGSDEKFSPDRSVIYSYSRLPVAKARHSATLNKGKPVWSSDCWCWMAADFVILRPEESWTRIVGLDSAFKTLNHHPQCYRMAGPKPSTPINERRSEETPNQNATDKSVIERHLTTLKEPSNRELIKPMLLDFNDDAEDTDEEVEETLDGKARACCLPEALTYGPIPKRFLFVEYTFSGSLSASRLGRQEVMKNSVQMDRSFTLRVAFQFLRPEANLGRISVSKSILEKEELIQSIHFPHLHLLDKTKELYGLDSAFKTPEPSSQVPTPTTKEG
ncbi:hypothetical protein Tco_0109161 [Tanacetum coccineum]